MAQYPVPMVMNMQTTIEEMVVAVFSMWFDPKLYKTVSPTGPRKSSQDGQNSNLKEKWYRFSLMTI
jgi:hypothetical protein